MHILFDHGTPRGISCALQGHIVKEARAQGWDTLSNVDLLKAACERIDVSQISHFDRHIEFSHLHRGPGLKT